MIIVSIGRTADNNISYGWDGSRPKQLPLNKDGVVKKNYLLVTTRFISQRLTALT
jgi:hypothetical protein